jgi:hypothetical protein
MPQWDDHIVCIIIGYLIWKVEKITREGVCLQCVWDNKEKEKKKREREL